MYNYTRDGITIAAVLGNRTNGTYPVRIRVNHNRTLKYISTGKNLTKEEFDSLSTTRNRSLSDIRKSIEESFYVVKENIDVLCQKGEFSFHALDTRLGNGTGGSVNKALESKIKQLDAEGRIGTKELNQSTLSILEEFGVRNIPFDVMRNYFYNKIYFYSKKELILRARKSASYIFNRYIHLVTSCICRCLLSKSHRSRIREA